MNCFEILGIEPTDNERDIKKAYANLLKIYHPEEQPEKFKEIYEAYKDAIQFVKFNKTTILQENQDIEAYDIINKQSDQEDIFDKTNDLENSYKQFLEILKKEVQAKKDIVLKIDEIENQNELRRLYELHQKNFQERPISKDTKLEELKNKFDFVINYEKKSVEKEKEINLLLAKLDRRPRDFDYFNKNVFNSLEFRKYCNDPLFIKEYIEMIDNGLYDNISMLDKILFKNFHKKVFFSTREAKKENERLYKSLYHFLYFDKRKIIENTIFISSMLITLILAITNNVIYMALVAEFIVFLLLSTMRSIKHRFVKVCQKLAITIFSVCIFLSAIFYFYDPSQSFGEYEGQTYSINGQILKQTSEGFIYGIKNSEGEVYIKTSKESYRIGYLQTELQDFGFDGDNLYYISENNVFRYENENPIMMTNNQVYKREITYNEDVCLLMEETIDGTVNVYQLKNAEAKRICSYNGFLSSLLTCKYYYLVKDKLYYISRKVDYLMCYNISDNKVEETPHLLTEVYSIGGIEDNLFFGGNYSYLIYNAYKFKGQVTAFVNLDNFNFAYINDSDMLYIVNYATEKEIVGIDLYEDYNIHQKNITSIAGNNNNIALIYEKYNRLEIHLK